MNKELESQLEGFEFETHEGITKIEDQVTEHLNETFEGREVSFDFPDFSMDYIFSRADIQIDETHLEGGLSKENVGEGVKRTLIFSLLRTLADIQQNRLSIKQNDEPNQSSNSPPLLILFEEAELFLYPQLQKQLLEALMNITETGNQVIFSTHSPVLIEHTILETINIVRKNDAEATVVRQFHTVLENEIEESKKSLVTDINSVSEYIFSDEIVLVEGVTDRIILEKLGPYLDENWDFRTTGIPIMEVGGKSEVTRFHNFLGELGIRTHSILDIDALEDQIENITEEPDAHEYAEELKESARDLFDGTEYSHSQLPTSISNMPWEQAFKRLQQLEEAIQNGDSVDKNEAELITKILSACETEDTSDLWSSSKLESERVSLVEALLEENILLLSGDIEDYYPRDSSKGKREAALAFSPESDYAEGERCSRFQELSSNKTDIEVFLERIFEQTS